MKMLNQKYHVLARGVILSEGHILVAHCKGMDNTFLPGGHVEFKEGIRATLSREIKEEFGQESTVQKYIGCVEADYETDDTYHQEINHMFRVELSELNYPAEAVSNESHLEFYWIPIHEMERHNVLPAAVRDVIRRYIDQEDGPFWESEMESK
ncbi:NUDIX hydrolase [Paenibacillus selenitireducens]|uniref:NUDIX hydrolase n=1 Tax=Paenibacillus selenitireducens TaxID=1324314 RepID=A0A1T2X246_9BACL|nr:NUDIX domain-containing protein [Paenibacillus selenitireducens]OPA73786.1 NUDIX hydrolase [Paenibacillus selenitireducens]